MIVFSFCGDNIIYFDFDFDLFYFIFSNYCKYISYHTPTVLRCQRIKNSNCDGNK